MAIKSVYGELFEQLPIPERLEPQNIAKMLEENKAIEAKRSGIAVSGSSENENKNKRTHSATYRAIMSVAACLVLAFGVVQYMGFGENDSLPTENSGANAAENYDELHKTFTKYYVDNSGKKTLDSAMAEIEHSYNEAEKTDETDKVEETPADTLVSEDVLETPPAVSEAPEEIPEDDNGIVVLPDDEEEDDITVVEDEVVLPDTSLFGTSDNVEAVGNRFFITEGDSVRIIYADGAELSVGSLIAPSSLENETKTLIDYYVYGDVLVCAYDVKTIEPLESDVVEAQTEDKTALDEILDGVFTEEVSGVERHYVEVATYVMINGDAYAVSETDLSGSFVDIKQVDGALYVITNYNDYRLNPIVGVSDLESYVPSYNINGTKTYLEPQDILIPEYVSTTDYTVIAGFDLTSSEDFTPTVKALLGYEGRILVTDTAAYIFGYENIDDTDYTTVQKIDLSGADVIFGNSILCEGVAIGGEGITEISGAIVISALKSTETGLVTSVCVYDSSLNPISKCDIPSTLTDAKKDGCVLMLSGSTENYNLDLANPAAPVIVEHSVEADAAQGLARYNEGFVTLTDVDGSLTLSLLSLDENLKFSSEAEKVVYTGEYTSKALEDNSLLFVDDVNGLIGVPYGYFDGYDILYRYDLFKVSESGIEFVGMIETHETDQRFEFAKAIDLNGYLYIFSEGRVYSALATSEAISPLGSCAIIESTYSGHIEW